MPSRDNLTSFVLYASMMLDVEAVSTEVWRVAHSLLRKTSPSSNSAISCLYHRKSCEFATEGGGAPANPVYRMGLCA